MSKKNINWQSIDQLPLFASLIEKMIDDTKSKLDLLRKIENKQANITDAELANILHVLHRQIEKYPFVSKQFKRWRGQSVTNTELKLIETALVRNEMVNELTRECQEIADKLMNRTIEAQEEGVKISSNSKVTIDADKHCSEKEYILTDEQVSYYKQLRSMLNDLHPKFIASITKEAVDRCGKRLEILQDSSLLLNTEHESDLFFDYCMHTYKPKNGSWTLIYSVLD